ncbi:hypothetical protein ACO229_04550 [Promicromonospora sp. MS192]|uniref:hypothetical protein n=1 Tax=Promicromonospora sp. MS192 TaxID=3412684 RepID=UPI003C2AC3F6
MSRVEATSYVRADGEFRAIAQASHHDGDCDYVPGAISLKVDGVELLGLDLWDDVNWLWPLVIQALDEFRHSGSGKRYFPDQPIAIIVEAAPWGGNLLLTVTTSDKSIHRTAVAPRDELFETVARAGAHFFRELGRLCGPESAAGQEEAVLRSWVRSVN